MAEQKPVIPREDYLRLLSLAEDFYRQSRQSDKNIPPEDLVSALVGQTADILAKTSRQDRRVRQAEGIAQAKRAGVRFGRPMAPTPQDFPALVQRWQAGEITFRQALSASGLSESAACGKAARPKQRPLKGKTF